MLRLACLLLFWFTLLTDQGFALPLTVVDVASKESTIRFKFFFSDLLNPSEAQGFAKAIKEAQKKVEDYWGNTFNGTFWVEVSPRYPISMALIPTWRGEHGKMVFPAHRVNQRQAAIIHEMVHVYAPNQNRLLAEGLAVYLHYRLGGNPAFPNFGKDLSHLTASLSLGVKLADLDSISTPTRLEFPGKIEEKDAYIVAGSFVGYLIEKYGLDKFKQLYGLSPLQPRRQLKSVPRDERDGQYLSIFGKSLDELEQEWLKGIRGIQ